MKEHFGILERDPPEVAAERVADREGLGFTLGLAPPEGMHPLTVRDRLRTSWVGFLQGLTTERPAAVLVEDLHWAATDSHGDLYYFWQAAGFDLDHSASRGRMVVPG